MNLFLNRYFVLALLLLAIHQFGQKVMGIQVFWADNWLDAFLLSPILGTVALWEKRTLFRKEPNFRFSILQTFSLALLFSIVSELVFPLLHRGFTADWFDVLAIFAGTIVFYFGINLRS